MSEKTKNIVWLPWAVSFSVVMALALVITYFDWDGYLTPPWTVADGISTMIAIESFKTGIFEEQVFSGKVLQAFLGLIFLFIIGPSLWIFSEIRNENRDEEDQLKKGPAWYTSTLIVVFGLITAVVGTAVNGFVFQNVWESTKISRNEDQLRMQLMKLGFDAYQLYYLPAEMGGGDGSFQIASAQGNPRPITLDDLTHFSDSLSNSYLIEQADSTNTLKIYGVGIATADKTFENANGEQGKVQLAVEVIPGEKIMRMD